MSGLFKKPDMPKIPKVTKPTPIPQPDDEQVQDARRRVIASEQRRSGVMSTLLSSGGRETLGG